MVFELEFLLRIPQLITQTVLIFKIFVSCIPLFRYFEIVCLASKRTETYFKFIFVILGLTGHRTTECVCVCVLCMVQIYEKLGQIDSR